LHEALVGDARRPRKEKKGKIIKEVFKGGGGVKNRPKKSYFQVRTTPSRGGKKRKLGRLEKNKKDETSKIRCTRKRKTVPGRPKTIVRKRKQNAERRGNARAAKTKGSLTRVKTQKKKIKITTMPDSTDLGSGTTRRGEKEKPGQKHPTGRTRTREPERGGGEGETNGSRF